jgi:hypothetical protein
VSTLMDAGYRGLAKTHPGQVNVPPQTDQGRLPRTTRRLPSRPQTAV